jgi:hypothetical protein
MVSRVSGLSHRLWHIHGMRTTLDIDDHLMEALMPRHPGATKFERIHPVVDGLEIYAVGPA